MKKDTLFAREDTDTVRDTALGGGAKPVEITIKGNENEISALVLAVQGRKNEQILDLTCGNSNNLIVENRKRIKTELCAILANNGHIF